MEKLSLRNQLSIVRLYLGGFSYDEIAAKAGVSQGSVANVIAELRSGRILDVQEPREQLDLLRELATDLHKCRLTPGQAVAGLAILSRVQELGVEPADIEHWAAMCRGLVAQDTDAQASMRAALALEEVKKRTGLSAEALEEKAHRLEEEVARLEKLRQELGGCQQELQSLGKRRQSLAGEVSQLEKRCDPLRRSISQSQQREAELSHRVQELEQRAQAADERLGMARTESLALARLGLSLEDLPALVERLGGVAQRHRIKPGQLRERLLHELEGLEAGLGLETLVEIRRNELNQVEQAITEAQQQRRALGSALRQLRQQQASLDAAIAEKQAHVHQRLQAIIKITKDAAAEQKQELGNGLGEALAEIQELRDQALELGRELGRFEATIEANQWLQTMVALAKGGDGVSARDVRIVVLAVMRSTKSWMDQNQSKISPPVSLSTWLGSVIEGLQRWKV